MVRSWYRPRHVVHIGLPSTPRASSSSGGNTGWRHVSVPGLGLTTGVAREGRPGSRDGIFRVGLALAPAALAVGTIDFDDMDPFILEVPREPGAIGAGPFDTD